jgi:hypothetical protein
MAPRGVAEPLVERREGRLELLSHPEISCVVSSAAATTLASATSGGRFK